MRRIANPSADPSANAEPALPGLCPRRYWRSTNPALPPPESPTCLVPGPDCCVTSSVTGGRRVA